MEFLQGDDSIYIWFTISFLVFLTIVVKFGGPVFNAWLDKKISDIKTELQTAENLRVEAQEMLAQYQRKHRDAMKESESIIKTAKESAKKIQAQAEEDLKQSMARREQQLAIRLKRMEEDALAEIKAKAATLAMDAARQIVAEKLDKNTGSALLENSIKDVPANIH